MYSAGLEPDFQLQDLLQSDPVPVQGIFGNHASQEFPWPSHLSAPASGEAGQDPSVPRGTSITPPAEAHSANTPNVLYDFPDSFHSFLLSHRTNGLPDQGPGTANGAAPHHGGNSLANGASTQPELTLPQPSPQGSLQDDSQSPAAAAASQQAKQEARQQRVREKNRRAMQKFRNRQRVCDLHCFVLLEGTHHI